MHKQYKKISGFSDEIDSSLKVQLESLNKLNISYMSIRGVGEKNIGDYDLESFNREVQPLLDEYNIRISSIGSPIGKIEIDDEEAFENQKTVLENLCQICKDKDIKYIRMFSFYMPEGKDPNGYKDEVLKKLKVFIDIANKYDVVLVHENEKDIFGDNIERCKVLAENLYGDNFGLIFDFANFVQVGEDTLKAYEVLKDYVLYIHIKDAKYETNQNVVAGTGDGNIYEILKEEFNKGYDGFITLEPHLVQFDSLKDLEKDSVDEVIKENLAKDGFDGFRLQLNAVNEILKNIEEDKIG